MHGRVRRLTERGMRLWESTPEASRLGTLKRIRRVELDEFYADFGALGIAGRSHQETGVNLESEDIGTRLV